MNTLTPEQLQKELDARLPACMGLERRWCSVIPGFCPDREQFGLWLTEHPFITMLYAIKETAKKFKRVKGAMDEEYLILYCSKVMNTHDAYRRER
jgi:hypothetical protein